MIIKQWLSDGPAQPAGEIMSKQIIRDAGVVSPSVIHAHVASAFAKSALYYLHFSGEYHCTPDYCIRRPYLDMFLIMFVRKGQLRCEFEGLKWTVNPNQLILMDCRQPHMYCASAPLTEFVWFHFSGAGAQAYYEHIRQADTRHLLINHPASSTLLHINSILQMMQEPFLNEQTASILIHSILRDIDEKPIHLNRAFHPITTRAITYLHEHFAENIRIDALANALNISRYYLIRTFRTDTDFTPHAFLIQIRIQRAMELLTNDQHSVETVAERCGFNSASHFTRSFKALTGTTPSTFRTLHSGQTDPPW